MSVVDLCFFLKVKCCPMYVIGLYIELRFIGKFNILCPIICNFIQVLIA